MGDEVVLVRVTYVQERGDVRRRPRLYEYARGGPDGRSEAWWPIASFAGKGERGKEAAGVGFLKTMRHSEAKRETGPVRS